MKNSSAFNKSQNRGFKKGDMKNSKWDDDLNTVALDFFFCK